MTGGPEDRSPGEPWEGPWPSYAFIPGGRWPHPNASKGVLPPARKAQEIAPPAEGGGERSEEFRRGVALFNEGYYWEAHEAWEVLWHVYGRRGATADVLKGLIKLAAAGVKVRERQPRGVVTHAARAAALFEAVREVHGPRLLGLDLGRLASAARGVAEAPPDDPGSREDRVTRVFAFRIEPTGD